MAFSAPLRSGGRALSRLPRAAVARARIDRWIEPHESVTGLAARRRARYTSVSILTLLPLAIAAFALTLVTESGPADVANLQSSAIAATIVVLAVLFPFSRRAQHAFAAAATVVVTTGVVWLLAWESGGSTGSQLTLFFLAVPILMSGMLLSPLGAAVVAVANVSAAMTTVPIVAMEDGISLGSAITPPFFLVVVSGFVVNSARLRERDLAHVERLAAELREQERERIQMLNNIAHDMGSPLTPLKLQLALVPKDTPIPPARLDVLRRNVGQLERLVADVKDLARMNGEGFSLHLAPIDVGDIVHAAVEGYGEEAKQRGLRFDANIQGPLPARADAQRLTQVVYNLVTNALKFTPDGGSVTLDAHTDNGSIVLRVRDTGRGLSPDEIARLFKPFSQVHERHEIKERGTGLGLYISRGIMERHGGTLDAASEGHGRGATFTLRMPASA